MKVKCPDCIYSIEEKIEDLKRKIAMVCVQCPHMNKRTLVCNAKGRHCNSKRVKAWRALLEDIETKERGDKEYEQVRG